DEFPDNGGKQYGKQNWRNGSKPNNSPMLRGASAVPVLFAILLTSIVWELICSRGTIRNSGAAIRFRRTSNCYRVPGRLLSCFSKQARAVPWMESSGFSRI